MRPWLPALLALALALLLAGAAVALWPGASPAGEALTPVPLAVDKTLGINTDLLPLTPAGREQALAAMEAGGLTWLRQRFDWAAIEPERGQYDWAAADAVVAAAREHGLALIAVLDGSPAWARAAADGDNALAPPVEVRDYGDWVAAFAARYGPAIDHYQVWDEPNIAPHWGAREIDPAAYARLLREGAIRLRAADPGAVVLLAALAPTVEPGGANMSELLFLDALYQQGAAAWFDVVAGQSYLFDDPPDAAPQAGRLTWRRLELLRQVMVDHGDAASALWAVAWGLPPDAPEAIAPVVERARANWPWLGPLLWAAWSPADAHGAYALTGTAGQPGPAYAALRDLALAPPVAWPGVYPPDHASGRYEGDWRVTPLGADPGRSGDRLAIDFEGTRLDLLVRRGDYRAFLYVTVDGRPANALPRDVAGRAYVVLYDPLHGQEAVTLAQGLAPGPHQAAIVVEGGWGQWAIGGWGVAGEEPPRPAWPAVLLGLAAGGCLLLAAGLAWPRRCQLAALPARLFGLGGAVDQAWLLLAAGLAALLLYAVPGTLPSLALLAVLGLLLLLRPETGLALIALSLPFYQLGKPFLGKLFSMVEILVLVTAVAWAIRWLAASNKQPSSWKKRLAARDLELAADLGVAALVAVGLLSLLWTDNTRVAARELRTVIVEGGIFYGLLRAMLGRRRVAWQVVDAWLLGGAIIAVIGLAQWGLGQNVITADGVWRVRGFYGSPNNLALYLGRLLPLALALAAVPRSVGEREQTGQGGRTGEQRVPARGSRLFGRRWLYGLAAVLMALALLLTYSRGAWLVGVPASLLFLAALRGRRALAVAVAGLAVLGLLVLAVAGGGRLTSLLETGGGTTFFRLQLWRSSLAMIADHPVLGVGLDNFLYQYRSHYVLPTAWEEFNLSHPHNLVFDFWLRLGLPGLALLLVLLAAFFRRGWLAFRQAAGPDCWLAAGLLAGMVNFVAHGLVDNAFFLVDLAFVFMLMLALVLSIKPRRQDSSCES